MTRRSKLWRAAGVVFVVLNLAGVGWGLGEGDLDHALAHVALIVGFAAFVTWRTMSKRRERQAAPQLPEQRLEYLQQSVDAIALEVERIGEKQRFAEKLRAAGDAPVKRDS